jgi:hypothetical protein
MNTLRYGLRQKSLLFSAIFSVLAIVSFCVFASPQQAGVKLTGIDIIGPNSVPANTQNVFHIAAVYDNGSIVEVTPDASINVNPDKHAVIILGGIVETFKLKQEQQFTISAKYQGFAVEKRVTIYPISDNSAGAKK